MSEFQVLTSVIAVAVLLSMGVAFARTRDSLHPSIALGPMILFLYVWMPLELDWNGGFQGLLTHSNVEFAQRLHVLGVLALLLGVHVGARGARFVPGPQEMAVNKRRLHTGALVLGLLGCLGFVLMMAGVGGVQAAYGRAYGGGSSESGYVGSLPHLTVPGILMLLAAGALKGSVKDKFWLAAFAAPFLLHGFLGARRGPTFLVFVTIVAGYFLVKNSRPRITTVLTGGAVLGALMIFLVENRGRIYLGSDLSEVQLDTATTFKAAEGNEFIYAAGAMITADALDHFTWGGRYATVLFVRPIPRAIWPTKYSDAAAVFGTNVELNMGIDFKEMGYVMGWEGAVGAAPGIVADMWIEFKWGMLVALYFFGWIYGRAWKGSVTKGGFATIVYGCLLSLSVYLILQTLEAVLFRALFMLLPAWLAWRWAGGSTQRAPSSRTLPNPAPVP